MGRDGYGVCDGRVCTGIFNMDNEQGPTIEHMELCSLLCGSLDWKRSVGENGFMCMYG